jgi:hypothetical protein
MTEIMIMADPRIAAIPVVGCGGHSSTCDPRGFSLSTRASRIAPGTWALATGAAHAVHGPWEFR